MNRDIVLVNPHIAGLGSQQEGTKAKDYMYPYSLVCLQSYLAKHGIRSRIFDLFHEPLDSLIQFTKESNDPIVGITSQTFNRWNAIDIAKRVKSDKPGSTVVVGGKHFSFTASDTLLRFPEIDIVVRGEGEITFLDLVRGLDGNSLRSIDGISYRSNGTVITNRDRDPEKDIDKFALDYEHIPEGSFSKGVTFRNFENENIRALPVLVGRGCSNKCAFCSYKMMPYRVRSMDSILAEIRYLKSKYNCSHYFFSDPSITQRKSFIKSFCETLINDKYNIKWDCEARVDTPPDVLELMAKAGCISLDFALESGSDRILKIIKKNITVGQCLEFAGHCKELNIRTLVFAMVSLPDEREEDAEMTLEVLKRLSEYTKYSSLNVGLILPGTEFETMAKEKGILPAAFSWYTSREIHKYPDLGYASVPLYVEHLSIEYIRKFIARYNQIYYKSYLSTKDVIGKCKRGMSRIRHQTIGQTLSDAKKMCRIIRAKILGN